MERTHRHLLALAVGSVSAGLLILACGARSGLDQPHHDLFPDAALTPRHDAGRDTGFDAGMDVSFDAGQDTFFPVDAIAPIDVHVAPDSALACPEGGLPNAYLFDNGGALYTFDPATLATHLLGTPDCGATAVGPWTLSVSREGNAYVVFMDPWAIYEVDLSSPALTCTPTAFANGQLDIEGLFSIAVSRNAGVERLFYYGEPGDTSTGDPNTPPLLAESDLTSFDLTEVAPIVPAPPDRNYPFDMQGDPLGNLFAYSNTGLLIEIDSATGAVIGQAQTNFPGNDDWAVMSYENVVYLFAATAGGTEVAEYDIPTQTLNIKGQLPITVLGASAVPCLRGGDLPP